MGDAACVLTHNSLCAVPLCVYRVSVVCPSDSESEIHFIGPRFRISVTASTVLVLDLFLSCDSDHNQAMHFLDKKN